MAKTSTQTTTENLAAGEPGMSIGDIIKAAANSPEEKVDTNTENDDNAEQKAAEPVAPTTWGSFTIEIGVTPPDRISGSSKYKWGEFPAPSDPNNHKTWPSVFIPGIGAKTIYDSIKKFRDAFQKEHGEEKPAPTFAVKVSKEPKGVRVFRSA